MTPDEIKKLRELLEAAAEIKRLRSLMAERAAHNGLGAGSIPAASTNQ